ncbi:uncharacterized protein PRCAT00000517001 [Priceomyces carsonii]|uniref:uncharacterized protein n=1 Tax=Priceomyces carsonii TaxID=28549 RepID=UPI002ED83360|nr:unnamed protein product [Priceomyces carsonii]
MPIKSLESYLFERKLVNTSSIEILQNATIGIDVDHYLSRIYTFKKEQFLAGTGGIPSSLKDYIQSDLQVFQEFKIRPIFVIPGLSIQLQNTSYRTNELSPQEQHLESTWSKLNNKQPYSSIESFRLFTDPLPLKPMINDLIKYFIEIGIDYLISPYHSSFQLSYLYQNNLIDSIYGSTDLLLTKADRFILGMEFQSKDFRFIDKAKILGELNLTEKQFVDLSIMVGCNIQPKTFSIFPPLPKPNPVQPYPQLSYFKLGLDIIYQYNTFNNANDLSGYIIGLNDPKLLELYLMGHSAIKFLPVLNKEGFVELYDVEMAKLGLKEDIDFLSDEENGKLKDRAIEKAKAKGTGKDQRDPQSTEREVVKVPNNVHDIISQRLPPELYFYQSIGLLPIKLLESITQGHIEIRPSLESGLSDSYKNLITSEFYTTILDYQFNLITQLLARYYQVKKINVKYWFKDEALELNNRLAPPVFQRVSSIFVRGPKSDKFSLSRFFTDTNDSNIIGSLESNNNNELISSVLLRALYLFGIFDSKGKNFSSIGIIFNKLIQKEKNISEEDLQELFLLTLLIKSKCLKLTEPNREFSSVPKYFKEFNNEVISSEEVKHITLVSRIFSLHKLHIAPINYQGPISRTLLNFRSHIKFLTDHFISTIQCLIVDLIVRQKDNSIKKEFTEKEEWYLLIDQLPFFRDLNNTLLGVVAEIYFEYSVKQAKTQKTKDEIIKNTKDHLLNYVYQINNPSFNINVHGVNSITGDQLLADFEGGIKFWNKFVSLAEIIVSEDSSLIDENYYAEIKNTDTWIQNFI